MSMKTEEVASIVARGTTFLFLMEIVVFLSGFATKIILAWWLTPADIGVITLVTAWVGLGAIVFLFGVPGSITKFVSEYLAKGRDPGPLFSTGLKIVFASAVIGSAIAFLASEFMAVQVFHTPEATLPFQAGAAIIFFTMLYRLLSYCVMGFQRMGSYVLLEMLHTVSMLVLTAAFLWLGYGLMGAVWAMVLPLVVVTVAGYLVVARLLRIDLSPRIDRGVTGVLVAFGVPFYASVVIEMVLGWTDTILLGFLTDSVQVGYYGIALWLMGIVIMLTRPLNTAIFPAFSAIAAGGDHDGLRSVLNYSTKYAVYIMLPAAAGIAILAEPIVGIFGPDFLPAVPAVRILAVAAVFSSLRAMGTKYIAATGEPRVIMKFIAVSVIIDLVLNFFLIQWYGIAGAATATTIAYAVFMGLCFWHITRTVRMTFRFLAPCAVACGLMSLALIGFLSLDLVPAIEAYGKSLTPYVELLLAVPLGAAIYGIALYLLNGFDRTDKQMIGGLVKKVTGRR